MSEENTVPVKCAICGKMIGRDEAIVLVYRIGYAHQGCWSLAKTSYPDMIQDVNPPSDPVNHPAHYKIGGIETIDFIRAKLGKQEFEAYCIGNVFKYLTRYRHKNGIEDLKKGQWYLNKAIESMQILEDILDARD